MSEVPTIAGMNADEPHAGFGRPQIAMKVGSVALVIALAAGIPAATC
jgi:hypothetical protein